jgi:hypothetical protein
MDPDCTLSVSELKYLEHIPRAIRRALTLTPREIAQEIFSKQLVCTPSALFLNFLSK